MSKIVDEVLKAGIADESDLVSFLFAPHRDDLRHNGGEIGVHDSRKHRSSGAFGDEVDDPNTKLSHDLPSSITEASQAPSS